MGSMANKIKKKVNGGKKKVKVSVNADEIDAYVKKRVLAEKESILKHEREKMIATVREWFLLESVLVLHDDYGYGRKRLADYLRRHVMKVKAMEVEGCSYQEIEDALKDEIGFDFGEEMKAVAKEVEGEFTDDDDIN